MDTVVIGGTAQVNDWSTLPTLEDTNSIMRKVSEVFPALSEAPIVSYLYKLSAFNIQLEVTDCYKPPRRKVSGLDCGQADLLYG